MHFGALCFVLVASAQTLNVKDFGAVGDGKTLDSTAIASAFAACRAAGGGTVVFPSPGLYLTGLLLLIYIFMSVHELLCLCCSHTHVRPMEHGVQ
jgi:hypothetical protein